MKGGEDVKALDRNVISLSGRGDVRGGGVCSKSHQMKGKIGRRVFIIRVREGEGGWVGYGGGEGMARAMGGG